MGFCKARSLCRKLLDMAKNTTRARYLEAGLCGTCGKEPLIEGLTWGESCRARNQRLYQDNREVRLASAQKQGAVWRGRIWDQFFEHYGTRCACPGCDVDDRSFLTIGHIAGLDETEYTIRADGTKRRKTGPQILLMLREAGWPVGRVQPECFNCNGAKARNHGVCPHTWREVTGARTPDYGVV